MSLGCHHTQADHCAGPHQLVTTNTYDWLQHRDELERAEERHRQPRSRDELVSLHRFGAGSIGSNALSRISSVFGGSRAEAGNIGVVDNGLPYDHRYEVQYSVFKPLEHYLSGTVSEQAFGTLRQRAKEHFSSVVTDCIEAIDAHGIEVSRIKAGSSGSYFVYGTESQDKPLGIFKPKEEEPYGPLSPKWSKWAHRTFFPCFFGRSCLIPNLGYICESAACLLDQRLQTQLVPYTDTVVLESSKFYDKRRRWLFLCSAEERKQKKLGSFQLFLNDYVGADEFLSKYPLPGMYRDNVPKIKRDQSATASKNSDEAITADLEDTGNSPTVPEKFEWTGPNLAKFRLELEKLIILDYIMRNTDRSLDNWMIKVVPGKEGSAWDITLAAIDNGLSFPWKHPDEWRSYPYGWLYLPLQILAQPFSDTTRSHFLPILTDVKWWNDSYIEFTSLFSRDSDFNTRMWKKQWAVLKGQAFNVVETLKDLRQGPLELVRRTRCLVLEENMQVPTVHPTMSDAMSESMPLQASSPMVLYSTPKRAISSTGHYQHQISGVSPATYPPTTNRANPFDQNEEHISTIKTVIIERLQVVNSTPVFTWY